MIRQIRLCLEMIPRRLWWRWGFSMFVTLIFAILESVSAAAIFALVSSVGDPLQIRVLPVVSTVAAWFPEVEPRRFVAVFAAAVAVFYVARGTFVAFVGYRNNLLIGDATTSLAAMFLGAYLRAPYAFFFRRNSANLIHQVNEGVSAILGGTLGAAIQLSTEVLLALGLSAVMLAAAPGITLTVATVIVGSLTLLFRLTRTATVRSGAEAHRLGTVMLQSVQQSLGAIKEIKVLGREEHFLRVYRDGREAFVHASARRGILDVVPRLMTETILAGGGLFVVVAVILTGGQAAEALPLLGLYGYSTFRLVPAANRIYALLNDLRWRSEPVRNLYEDYRNLIAERTERGRTESGGVLSLREGIALSRVSFSYAPDAHFALSDVTFDIRRGESIGVVGPTGAGKSTLVDLIIGLLEPTAGCITVDGVDVRRCGRAWQRCIGYVPQEIYLIDDTLRRNIALGVSDPEIDEERLAQAVRAAQIETLVASLADGLDSVVGERGIRLSGGQRQRVGIARALYHQPEVLVFDEATSSLDNATESEVVDSLEALHGAKTMIVIAHRLTTVRRCDRLVFLRNGRIAAIGSYEDLLATNEDFRRMALPGARDVPSETAATQ